MLKVKSNYIFVLFVLIFFIIISVSWLGRLVEDKMSDFVFDEVDTISKNLIRDILNEDFFNQVNVKDLFVVEKNYNNEIEFINFDTSKVNSILGKVNDEITLKFDYLDKGNDLILFESSSLFQKYNNGDKSGIYLNVPLGIVFSNPVLVSIGPRVPIKLIFSGQVESDIVTSIKQYGINNVLLQIDIKIVVVEKIIFPFSNRYVETSLTLPLVIELISGKVPENYLNNEKFDIIEWVWFTNF